MPVDQKRYCGVVFIGGRSSWAYAPTVEAAAKGAVKVLIQDWKHLFKFKKGDEIPVYILDMKDHAGWIANAPGEFCSTTTKQPIPPIGIRRMTI